MNNKILIILRGPAGAGKSSVQDKLIKIIGEQKTFKNYSKLNLDQIEESKFDQNMKKAESEIVIGEMFSGDQHTTNPEHGYLDSRKGSIEFFHLS